MSILIPAIAAVLLALLCLPRLRKHPRPAAPEPERIATVTALPDPGPERQPFAFDAGLIVGERDS